MYNSDYGVFQRKEACFLYSHLAYCVISMLTRKCERWKLLKGWIRIRRVRKKDDNEFKIMEKGKNMTCQVFPYGGRREKGKIQGWLRNLLTKRMLVPITKQERTSGGSCCLASFGKDECKVQVAGTRKSLQKGKCNLNWCKTSSRFAGISQIGFPSLSFIVLPWNLCLSTWHVVIYLFLCWFHCSNVSCVTFTFYYYSLQ